MSRIRTLLLTGENNHDWRRTTPICRELLEESGRFEVTVCEDPSVVLANPAALEGVQLLFSDYNGPEWSTAAKANFEAVVHGGTGLVILHAADNAFRGWTEYEKMVGLLWREGTGHGQFHEFPVTICDKGHPITRGLKNFRTWDELYHRLVHMHDVPCRVLATAYSDANKGGTGGDEPVMVITQYGTGRVYHHVLGHIWPGDPKSDYKGTTEIAFEPPEFRKALLRGCEWAATGQVAEG